jgi:hypothetical protein
MKAQKHDLDFTVTLTPEDARFTDEVVAAGVPLIVASMFGKSLRKLVEAEREACAKVCDKHAEMHRQNRQFTFASADDKCAHAIRKRGQ